MVAQRPGSSQLKHSPTAILRVVEDWIPAALMAVMTIAVTSDVVMRYIFNNSIAEASSLAKVSMLWMIFLGSAGVSRRGAQICLDYFSPRLSGKGRAILDIVVETITITVLSMLGYAIIAYLNAAKFVPMPGLGLSKRYISLAAAIGILLMILHSMIHLIRAFRGLQSLEYWRTNIPIEEIELEDFNTQFIQVVDKKISGAQENNS